jgi:hypothetical protein
MCCDRTRIGVQSRRPAQLVNSSRVDQREA